MPDLNLTPLWNIGSNLLFYGAVTTFLFVSFTDVKFSRMWQGLYLAAMAYWFITALVSLLLTAKSLGLF